MIVLRGTQDRFLEALHLVSGIVERRHTLPRLANVLIRGNTITNGMPNCGGGDVSTDVAGASTGVTDGPDVAAGDDDDGGDSDGEPARRSPLKHPSPSGKHRNVTATAGALSVPQNPDIALWRLPTVLAHVPVSKSEWWHGIKTGRYPAGIKLSPRVTAWRSSDIRSLIASF